MNFSDLSDREFDLLLEGLDSIGKHQDSSRMMGEMLGSLMFRGDEKAMKEMERKRVELEANEASKRRLFQEQLIILKAKLVTIRQSRAADQLIEASR